MSDSRNNKHRHFARSKCVICCDPARKYKLKRELPPPVFDDASMAWYARELSCYSPRDEGTCDCPRYTLAGELVPPLVVPAYAPLRVSLLEAMRVT